MHLHRRKRLLRWRSDFLHQLGCVAIKHHHHSSNCELQCLSFSQLLSSFLLKPELLTGSLRKNLDLFEQYDDATLNSALRAAGLFALQSEMDEGKITLDSEISSGGGNLSVGQRQILALGLLVDHPSLFCANSLSAARAIVRGSKLLILDEATSAIGKLLRRVEPTIDLLLSRLQDRLGYPVVSPQ